MPITLITGANSGMGYETALAFGKLGHRLILCVRSPEKGDEALSKMRQERKEIEADVFALDLASMASVRECAEKIKSVYSAVDNVIMNAGVMTPPFARTEDGFELQFQSNYLGHFYLFALLQKQILDSTNKRVISVSSSSSEKGVNDSIDKFEADARCAAENYDAMKCYRESKLAQVLFARELNNRFGSRGVRSHAVHPGVVNTNLFYRNSGGLYAALMQPLAWLGYASGFIKTPRQGAETAVHLAAEDVDAEGFYWADKKIRPHNPIADKTDFCREFWDWSTDLAPDLGS